MSSAVIRASLGKQVAAAHDRLIETTRRLVSVASPNPPSDTYEVARMAEELLRAIPGIEIERIEPAPRVVSLVARIKGGRPGRRLIFNGHLDTFPLAEDLPWTVPPLGGVLKDGKLYGRGVCDMKGGMGCRRGAFLCVITSTTPGAASAAPVSSASIVARATLE